MIHDIPERDRAGLREFGWVTGSAIAGIFGLLLPWLFGFSYPLWPWIVGGVLTLWALVAPDSLAPVYRGWMRFALLLNRVTTPVIMGVVFFVVFTPVALVKRLVGSDAMARKFDRSAASYRVPSKKAPRENMKRPF
jgi:hypothetical protein